MAYPKTELFSEFDQKVSSYGRLLGHPARIEILQILEMHGPTTVGEFERLLPLSQGSITEHLRKLRLAGLIRVDIQGLYNYYILNLSGLQALFETQNKFEMILNVSLIRQNRENGVINTD